MSTEDELNLTLSEKDSLLFLDLLENPPMPNEKLKELFKDERKPPWETDEELNQNKPKTTYERLMQDEKFKKEYLEEYKKFLEDENNQPT